MNKTLIGIIVAAGTVATPALADFYIIQDSATKQCRIVEERPAPSVGIVVGDGFGARVEAENRMRTVEVCHEGTTSRSNDVIIDKR